MKFRTLLLLISAVFLGAASETSAQTSSSSPISIDHPWARATAVGARTGAAYLTIVNHSSSADRLIRASTPLAEKVQFHQENDDNGIMRMREMAAVAIGPGTSVTLNPGGTHIMIAGLKQQLREGQTLPLTLEFEKAGKIELQVPIAKAGAMGDHDMSGMQAQ